MSPLKVNLEQEFSKRKIKDISPDGTLLCFENWVAAKYPLEVVEIGTWKMIFSGSFQTRVWFADFFSDSKSLIAETLTDFDNRTNVPHFTLVDLQTGTRTEVDHLSGNPYEDDPVRALGKEVLLVKDIDWKSIENCYLVLVDFPTYREIIKVPFIIKSDEPELSSPADLINALSKDKSIFVYCYGRTLVCRRTKDFRILWTRKIEPPIGAKMIMSPNENYYGVKSRLDLIIH
jgi:hypothetical protein